MAKSNKQKYLDEILEGLKKLKQVTSHVLTEIRKVTRPK